MVSTLRPAAELCKQIWLSNRAQAREEDGDKMVHCEGGIEVGT
jgi:hypothetical protein